MLLSTAYLPPIEYFQKINSVQSFSIEKHEYFVKQTYRNRCHISGPNGIQVLSIPLINTHEKILISEKEISYTENWQKQHWRSITAAYANSPYFIYYSDELKPFYENKFEFLFDYNTELLEVLLKLLKIKNEIKFTKEFEKEILNDFRDTISPKNRIEKKGFKSYTQVFSDKNTFTPNLSIIDLLFNRGQEALEFL
jgi:hypothetical protein